MEEDAEEEQEEEEEEEEEEEKERRTCLRPAHLAAVCSALLTRREV